MAGGAIVNLILALVVVEFIALAWWRVRRGRGVPIASLAVNLAAGGSLLLALRAGLAGDQTMILVWLAAAGLAHAADVALRWR